MQQRPGQLLQLQRLRDELQGALTDLETRMASGELTVAAYIARLVRDDIWSAWADVIVCEMEARASQHSFD